MGRVLVALADGTVAIFHRTTGTFNIITMIMLIMNTVVMFMLDPSLRLVSAVCCRSQELACTSLTTPCQVGFV